MYKDISKKEIAVTFLIKNIPFETFQRIDIDKPDWQLDQHFGLGMDIRNLLRHGGFEWDDVTLDGLWYELFAKAANKLIN